MATNTPPASQTLSRGIRILELLADARGSLTIDQVAQRLTVHRSVAYRLLRTLEDHGLVTRDDAGRVELGARMAALAAGVAHDLQAEAIPELTAAANDLGMTCFLVVLDRDECVTLVSVEPRHALASVAQRPGTRHPVSVGAPGKAILSALPPALWPADLPAAAREDVAQAVALTYATSHDEVIPTLRSVAVPLTLRGRQPCAIAVVYVASAHETPSIAARLRLCSTAVRDALGG
ncbi:helix-turn-helix domain-containing protein [Microbacterium sp. LRZ72]|uniref:IclR family transcriptional regulator n=1 Tax=Microbacterium sp. LRZ72 TaxID=2942481 RepID=UPI0029BE93BB|nr:helix-turn-helix domain-containing protein [Microbacterium sp. LRZ72]MDX2376924.1 helix-turn-helix domain-containing protein [Microbacterium sp. LRZ72]